MSVSAPAGGAGGAPGAAMPAAPVDHPYSRQELVEHAEHGIDQRTRALMELLARESNALALKALPPK